MGNKIYKDKTNFLIRDRKLVLLPFKWTKENKNILPAALFMYSVIHIRRVFGDN